MEIAALVRKCRSNFEQLRADGDAATADAVEEEQGRFAIWVHNTSAQLLDYRLRDSQNLHSTVRSLLLNLLYELQELKKITRTHRELNEPSLAVSTRAGPVQGVEEIHEIISLLNRLSSTINHPSKHTFLRERRPLTLLAREKQELQSVFPNASLACIDQLAQAVAARRQFIVYRNSLLARASASLLSSIFIANESGESFPAEYVSLLSATNHTPQEQISGLIAQSVRWVAVGQKLTCPVCKDLLEWAGEIAWRNHLYEDLQPYICTHGDCTTPNRRYAKREEWELHRRDECRSLWNCPADCAAKHDDLQSLTAHVAQDHPQLASQTQGLLQCSLCKTPCISETEWHEHVGHHLEVIALVSVPIHDVSWTSLVTLTKTILFVQRSWRSRSSKRKLAPMPPEPQLNLRQSPQGLRQSIKLEVDKPSVTVTGRLRSTSSSAAARACETRTDEHRGGFPYRQLALVNFDRWLNEQTIPAYDITTGQQDSRGGFVPNEAVAKYFAQDRYAKITQILKAVFDTRSPQDLDVFPSNIVRNCARVFCILFTIHKAKHIRAFTMKERLFDRHLPFNERPEVFPESEDPEFWPCFYAAQWRFCSPMIWPDSNIELQAEYILPFTSLERTSKGNFGIVYKAHLRQEHDGLPKEDVVPDSPTQTRCFAVKSFTRKTQAKVTYERETRAFNRIAEAGMRSTPGMIRFFCSFKFRETFNIVLEFADMGNLEDFMQKQSEPEDAQAMVSLWKQVLEITNAVFTIHQQYLSSDNNARDLVRKRWHQDLKPQNILVLSRPGASVYGCAFKIADLGLAHFRTTIGLEDQETTGGDTHGTISYGAPECHPKPKNSALVQHEVSNKIDVWSMGCILSELAVWSVNGKAGLEAYRSDRQRAIELVPGFDGGDCFHDGAERLKVVDTFHRRLKRRLRDMTFPDLVIGPILDGLVYDMLHRDPNLRFTAEAVKVKAGILVSQAQKSLEEELDENRSSGEASQGDSKVQSGRATSYRTSGPPSLTYSWDTTDTIDEWRLGVHSEFGNTSDQVFQCPLGCGRFITRREIDSHYHSCETQTFQESLSAEKQIAGYQPPNEFAAPITASSPSDVQRQGPETEFPALDHCSYADHPDIYQFGKWLAAQFEPSYDTTSGRRSNQGFVPNSSIQRFFQGEGISTLTRVLMVAFGKSEPRHLTVDPAQVAAHCPRIFCILFCIGRVTWIRLFVQHLGLYDDSLPFYAVPPDFPSDPENPDFFAKFYAQQWRFCAPTMRRVSTMNIRKELVLPFVALERKWSGGSGTVFKIRVHEGHDDLIPSGASSTGRNALPHAGHFYAVKTYRRNNAQADYQREDTAFRQLTEGASRSTPGMVQFYCGFVYKDSFNIVLEFADMGNLEEYFRSQGGPSTPEDVVLFWSNLLELTKALLTIHNRRYNRHGSSDGLVHKGWNQELKPENILVFSNHSLSVHGYTFKVCDLSFDHFKTAMEGIATDATDYDSFGTTTYGAPECHPSSEFSAFHSNLNGNEVEIWSLGCIFSEAAVWVVKGYPGLLHYRERRRAAVRPDLEFTGGDCFHDGTRRLAEVDDEHRQLRHDVIQSDFITIPVVDSLVDDMLHEKPGLRYNANQVEAKAERLLRKARALLKEHKEHHVEQNRTKSQIADEISPSFQSGAPLGANSAEASNHARTVLSGNAANPSRPPNPLSLPLKSPHPRDDPAIRGVDTSYLVKVASAADTPLDTTQTVQEASKPIESYCTLEQATQWHRKRKYKDPSAHLPNEGLISHLKGRDHIFIVDDSRTMSEHWDDVAERAKLLTYITKREDPDGVELYFLSSEKRLSIRNSTDMAKKIKKHKPVAQTSLDTAAFDHDIRSYGQMISSWVRSGSLDNTRPRRRSIYFLTDGAWEAGGSDQGQDSIEFLVDQLAAAHLPRNQIGIQLISFGEHRLGLPRLQALDRLKLTKRLKLDIVDTEPSQGDVWKMLLGAILPKFDGDSDEPLSPG